MTSHDLPQQTGVSPVVLELSMFTFPFSEQPVDFLYMYFERVVDKTTHFDL